MKYIKNLAKYMTGFAVIVVGLSSLLGYTLPAAPDDRDAEIVAASSQLLLRITREAAHDAYSGAGVDVFRDQAADGETSDARIAEMVSALRDRNERHAGDDDAEFGGRLADTANALSLAILIRKATLEDLVAQPRASR